jgi:diguanylate cyclase (GGDEF)-like protein
VITKFFKKISSLASLATYHKQPLPAFSLQSYMIAASIITTGLVLGIRELGKLEFLELVTFDKMVRLQADTRDDPRLLVVAITEADLKEQKQWPISDLILSQALEKLQQAQPKTIGIDLYRDLPQPPGREALLKQVQQPNIITIKKLEDINTEGVAPIAGIPLEKIGFNDLIIDSDGIVRRNLIYAYQGEKKYYSFSLRLSLKYLADQNISFKVTPDALHLGDTAFPPLYSHAGGYQNLDDAGYQVLISYGSSKQVARQITFTDVLRGNFDRNWVKNKVVLIGTTAPSLKDLFFTPYSAGDSVNPGVPGVMLHAQMVSQILSTTLNNKPLFWFWPEWVEALWIWLWALVGGLLAWQFRHPLYLGIAGLASLAVLFTICLITFTQAGWIPLLPPALTLIVTSGSVIVYKLWYNALHDSLTGLPNRLLFLKYLQKALDKAKNHQQNRFAVFYLDIDRFKIINESIGHHIGDKLLVSFSQRLKVCIGHKGVIARVGGDEFVILLNNIADGKEATSVADELQKQMILPFKHHGQEIFTTISIGIAFNQIELSHLPEDLFRDAHTAMYRAKDLGKARHEVFATGMHAKIVKRFQLETDMRRAIENQEFTLNYQAIVIIKTAKIVGFEALVRWQHPQHGFISPVQFIPVAEETGLIIPLGKWIFQEACRQLSIWQAQYPSEPPLMMSINLSGKQFTQPDLIEYIEQIIKTMGLKSGSLKLEVTESIAMDDVESAIAILLNLRGLNIQLSIDDFGTGYSSLSYLHRFPVNTLKIDRSFVIRMGETNEDASIVNTIIMLSHTLGMNVVAEGVETKEQQAQLEALGCEYGQGYLFSKPVDSEAATILLNNQLDQDE